MLFLTLMDIYTYLVLLYFTCEMGHNLRVRLLYLTFIYASTFIMTATGYSADESINCIDGKIKYIENKKEVMINDRYCFDTILKSLSSTVKCSQGCIADSVAPLNIKRSELNGQTDSPPFKICRKASGVPQQVDYWATSKWISTSRCLYPDGSYQDINRLISSRVKYED